MYINTYLKIFLWFIDTDESYVDETSVWRTKL